MNRVMRIEGRQGAWFRWLLLLAGTLVLRGWGADASLSVPPWYAISAAYCVLSLVITLVFGVRALRARVERFPITTWRVLMAIVWVVDLAFCTFIVGRTGGYRSAFFFLYGLIAIKAAIYYPNIKDLVFVSFLSGLLWMVAAFYEVGGLFFLGDRGFIVRYVSLLIYLVAAVVVGVVIERRQRSISDLGADLSRKDKDLNDQARIRQQSAADLANRLLELRSLQESVKVINSALGLDELLQVIVENATQVLRGARCTIALVDERRQVVLTSAAAGIPKESLWGTMFRVGQGVAGWVVEHRRSALIESVAEDERFRPIGNWPIESMVSVPLISGGQVIGALTATSPEPGAFAEGDVRLLDAFGDQAAIAVKNARLYEQLLSEEKETARLYQSVLEKSRELEAVLRGIGDGVVVVDPDLSLLMMNPVAARILRVHRPPQEGVRLPEIVSNDQLLALVHDTLANVDAPVIQEIAMPETDDGSVPTDAARVPIYQALASAVSGADAHVRGVVVVLRDITSQKEIEQIKSDFLSVVSHELRTPLHSIKGFVDIILMGKTGEINDLQRDFLTTVKESTTNLQRLIDDLLEFSRMEAGRIKLRPEMISLYAVAEKVVERLNPLAQEGDLLLVNEIPENLAHVEADAMRIEQVLTNLVSNACKFTREGSVRIVAEDAGDQIQVSVHDTGIGIPETEQPNIFQRFYQVDGSTTRSYRGAGLGLTICKFIVEYHRGRIWVESVEGEGSIFYFCLPKTLPTDEDLVIDFTVPAARRSN